MTHRFHFRRLVWLGILSGLLLPAVAKAALLVSEPFAYPVGQVLNGQTGGTGFSGPWVEAESPPNDDIEADDLSRDSLAVSGNSLHSFSPSAVGTDLSRALATPIAGTAGSVLWCSFLIRKDSEGSSAGSNYCGLVLYPSNSSASALFIGDTGENDFYSLGIAGLASGQVASTQQSLVSATATFLVVKITFQSGADKIQLFINPDPSQPEPTVAAATKADLDLQDIGSVGILSGTDATWHLDEIRVGPDFAEVAPSTAVPTPTPDPTPTPSPSPSPSASPDPTPVTGDTLANISTRGRVEAGDNVLIGGFIIRGDPGKKVVIRAIGLSPVWRE
jgi:hypothetical protein